MTRAFLATTLALVIGVAASAPVAAQGGAGSKVGLLSAPAPTRLECTDVSGRPGDIVCLLVRLVTADGAGPVRWQPIEFRMFGREMVDSPCVTDMDGVAFINYVLPPNRSDTTFTARFEGNTLWEGSECLGTIQVATRQTAVALTAAGPRAAGAYTRIEVSLTQASGGTPISGQRISLAINKVVVAEVTTDANGSAVAEAQVPAGTPAGSATVRATFGGGGTLCASWATTALTVNRARATSLSVRDVTVPYASTYYTQATLSGVLPASAVATASLKLYLQAGTGWTYWQTTRTNAQGIAPIWNSYRADLVGSRKVKVLFMGDGTYSSCSATYNLVVLGK